MTKIKLLYDIEQLLVSKGKETGICRVSLEILKRISKKEDYEVYPVVTVKKGNDPELYLEKKGLKNLIPNIVRMPYLKKTTQNYNLFKKFRCYFLIRKYKKEYLKILNQFDEYISLFSPISPIVYKSRVKTKIIVYDLIPLIMPETCLQKKFVQKYNNWIKSIQADEVICISKATKNDFFRYRPDYADKKTKIIYLAANEKFKPTNNIDIQKRYNIPTEKYFLAVSDFNPRKNLIHSVKSFLQFLNQSDFHDVSLVLVGPKTSGFKILENYIKDINKYQDRIICTGFVADEDLPALYSRAMAFLYPSLYEGFGLPILEAMQCGTPVITCRNSSLAEVGEDSALYVSETDVSEMVLTLTDLYQNSEKRQELSQKGIQHAKRFNWDETVYQIFNQ